MTIVSDSIWLSELELGVTVLVFGWHLEVESTRISAQQRTVCIEMGSTWVSEWQLRLRRLCQSADCSTASVRVSCSSRFGSLIWVYSTYTLSSSFFTRQLNSHSFLFCSHELIQIFYSWKIGSRNNWSLKIRFCISLLWKKFFQRLSLWLSIKNYFLNYHSHGKKLGGQLTSHLIKISNIILVVKYTYVHTPHPGLAWLCKERNFLDI